MLHELRGVCWKAGVQLIPSPKSYSSIILVDRPTPTRPHQPAQHRMSFDVHFLLTFCSLSLSCGCAEKKAV